MMWPDLRLCDLFGIEHPIIQAPMSLSSTPELAVAVCKSGGLGSLGCGETELGKVRADALRVRAGTNRSFNLNFFAHPAPRTDSALFRANGQRLAPWYDKLGLGNPADTQTDRRAGFDDTKLELLLELRPSVVSFHFGVPGDSAIASLKAAGIKLISSASTVAEAVELERRGMDAVIAQGWEAGGHRGSHRPTAPWEGVGTMALVPQVVDAVKVPVIAAGGIGDGRGIAAAFALGASGVQMGTAFLSCTEAATDPVQRGLLRRARDTDTIMTDSISGRSARCLRSRYVESMETARMPLPDFPVMYDLTNPITAAGDDEEGSFHIYGQAAALNRELPAAELMHRLVDETASVFAGLSRSRSG